jgi:hypothetical protein
MCQRNKRTHNWRCAFIFRVGAPLPVRGKALIRHAPVLKEHAQIHMNARMRVQEQCKYAQPYNFRILWHFDNQFDLRWFEKFAESTIYCYC